MRLKFQVEKVLQMAIFEKTRMKLNLVLMDINKVLYSVIDNFKLQMVNSKGKIHTDLKAVTSSVMVDEIHFMNAISNLIDNAIKYSKGQPDITISTRNTRKGIIIVVEDKGIGISKDDLKRIFDKFYRVQRPNNVIGTGLGLSICKGIVEAHGGSIEVENRQGGGTIFTVQMPVEESQDI